jgi:hypothetical protein
MIAFVEKQIKSAVHCWQAPRKVPRAGNIEKFLGLG